ncbi:MAG: GHKL domain-containing protein [Oscillospiraceae bacterium]|nr:GHKL domain-containing protein [Oscillospiraceae bacterium]
MGIDWIAIESLAVAVEVFAIVYFLNSRYDSRIASPWPQFATWTVMVGWGLLATFCKWPSSVYDTANFGLLLIYLLIFKKGRFLSKIFGVVLAYGVATATTLIGAGLATAIIGSSFKSIVETQGTARLLAIISIKMLQIVTFYILAKKHLSFRSLKKRPVWMLCSIAMLDFFCIFLIWFHAQSPNLNTQQQHVLTWIATGLLIHLFALFVMYELFVKEEKENTNLSAKLQRVDLESKFYQEIDAMYKDMRTWRHDYRNNLIGLRARVENVETDEALKYIDNILGEPAKNLSTLQTGNLVLDAVVSSKLWLAQSRNIEVSIQAVYPKDNNIKDHDLCSIAGNLLDNALEACGRMTESDGKKFIEFILLLKGKNLTLSIRNSFNGEINEKNGKYVSLKQGRFHGIGLAHVESIVKKYQGHIERVHGNGVFETCVLLPLLSTREEKSVPIK